MMSNTTNSMTLSGLMVPGKNILKIAYKLVKKVYEFKYDEFKTEQKTIITYEMVGSQPARETAEGEESALGILKDGGQKSFTAKDYTIAFPFTRNVLQDNLYSEEAPQILKNLLMAQVTTANVMATAPFNNCKSTNPLYLCWDNMPIASNNHRTENEFVSNTLRVDAPLIENTYWELITKILNMLQPSSQKQDDLQPTAIIAHTTLIRQLEIILTSPFRPGVSSWETNVSKGTLPDGYYVNRYLNPNTYIVRTNEEGVRYVNRDEFSIGQNPWYNSWTILVATIMRYCFGIDNFRSVFIGTSAPTGSA